MLKRTCFGSTYTKIGTIQRRLAWPLRKDDTQNREAFHILPPNPTHPRPAQPKTHTVQGFKAVKNAFYTLFGTTFRTYDTFLRTKFILVVHLGNVWDKGRACPGHCKLFLMDPRTAKHTHTVQGLKAVETRFSRFSEQRFGAKRLFFGPKSRLWLILVTCAARPGPVRATAMGF